MSKREVLEATCKNCGSKNVEVRAWIHQQTGNTSGETGDDNDTWCNDCEGHHGVNMEFVETDEPTTTEKIQSYLKEFIDFMDGRGLVATDDELIDEALKEMGDFEVLKKICK